jgi:hypothetical protein
MRDAWEIVRVRDGSDELYSAVAWHPNLDIISILGVEIFLALN